LLLEHAWPGNIRQLGHVLRTAVALSDGQPITREHLPSMAASPHAAPPRQPASPACAAPAADAALGAATDLSDATDGGADDNAVCPVKLNPIQANERQMLLLMLEQNRWNVSNVAKALDVSRNTLYRKLHKLRIRISHPEQA
jgi:transcriptional regulator of acetoin/glycerol metabolism